jgi:hypothetical protein
MIGLRLSSRFPARLHAQAGAISGIHPRLYAGARPPTGRSRHATLLPRHPALGPPDGAHLGARPPDPATARNRSQHRTARRSRNLACPTKPNRQNLCAEELGRDDERAIRSGRSGGPSADRPLWFRHPLRAHLGAAETERLISRSCDGASTENQGSPAPSNVVPSGRSALSGRGDQCLDDFGQRRAALHRRPVSIARFRARDHARGANSIKSLASRSSSSTNAGGRRSALTCSQMSGYQGRIARSALLISP